MVDVAAEGAFLLGTIAMLGLAFVLLARNSRLSVRHFWAWTSVGITLFLLSAALWRDTAGSCLFAAYDAVSIYMWIKNGGGKGPRKKIRAFPAKFKPVRRTAPVSA